MTTIFQHLPAQFTTAGIDFVQSASPTIRRRLHDREQGACLAAQMGLGGSEDRRSVAQQQRPNNKPQRCHTPATERAFKMR